MFADEAHLHLETDLGWGWAPRGQRLYVHLSSPPLARKLTCFGFYALGATQPVRLWTTHWANAETTCQALRELRDRYPERPLILVWVDKNLGCEGGDGLAFALALNGDAAAALVGTGSKTRLELRDAHAAADPAEPPMLVYSDLFAVDADGKELPSRMRLSEREVRLEVDAAGARYPVTVDPMWTQQGILLSADGAESDAFGTAVAIDGDTAILGAPQKTVGMNGHQGQAYVFVRSGTAWSQQAVLLDWGTGTALEEFGHSVALSGDTAVIGAPGKDVGTFSRQGQAHVFVRSGTSWSQQAVLVDLTDGKDMDRFGASVGISGDTVVIGANEKRVGTAFGQGQAYVYVRSGTSWAKEAVLVDTATGAVLDEFGHSVAISGDTIVIGASRKTVGTSRLQGQAYVYARTGTTWNPEAVLVDKALGESQDFFGASVAVSGDIAVIGAPLKGVKGRAWQGQAYVYVRSGTGWSQDAVLVDSAAGTAEDFFSTSVALSGKTILIGAPLRWLA